MNVTYRVMATSHPQEMREKIAVANEVVAEPYEEELVGRAKGRSPEAWTEIYRSHYPPIYRYVKARVFDEATAEDLTSAVFVAALKGIDSYKYKGRPLLAWLYRIARNVVASHQRRLLDPQGEGLKRGLDMPRRVIWHLMRQARPSPSARPESIASGTGDPAMMVESLDLRDALQKLPSSQREVVILRFLVGLSAREVAEVVGKKPAAVYSLQARAILSLRDRLS
jgi:RNA polymerase sigma-70 factor (ECF subfamily)